jgi:hypothetical protein
MPEQLRKAHGQEWPRYRQNTIKFGTMRDTKSAGCERGVCAGRPAEETLNGEHRTAGAD